MLSSDIFAIDEVAIAAVCGERWRESQTLEFKATLPATDDRACNEFLKDVCALVNSSGGDIVYGIRENAGHADAPTPIPVASFPVDVTKRRLAQILESGLEPRLAVQMHPVPFASGDYVLIVRVPASFQRPHRYKMQQHMRWVVPADTHTADLTYDQIREAFDRSATIAERARRFRDERLAAIISGTSGHPMRAGPKCVVHLIPLASVAGKVTIDIRHLYNNYTYFLYQVAGGWTRSSNLDGLIMHPAGHGSNILYTQIFRNGALEAARFGGALWREDDNEGNVIPSGVVSGFIRDAES